MTLRKSNKQYIQECIEKHGTEKYNYDETNYQGKEKKVRIFCNIHCLICIDCINIRR